LSLLRRLLAAGLATILLSGCAELGFRGDAAGDFVGQLETAPENFAVSGRLSLRQGERSDHLQFDWQHSPERDVVLFLSPLGQGLAEITRDASGARLTRPNGQQDTAPDLNSLTQQVLGAPLPLGELGEWLRGARGVSGTFDGWQIAVTQVAPFHQRRLPRRLEASRDEVNLTLIVDDWGPGD